MRISHRYKFVFIANPRTASTTVRRVLGPYADIRGVLWREANAASPFHTHMKAASVKQIFDERGWDWYAYKRFCVVRNPYDRVVSLYCHQLKRIRLRDEQADAQGANARKARTSKQGPMPFSVFVADVLPKKPIALSLPELVNDAAGTRLVETVLRFEDLHAELPEYLRALDIKIDAETIPHLRPSAQRMRYQTYYDSATRRLVEQRYGAEIEEFGYAF